jgi:hypothetical protein
MRGLRVTRAPSMALTRGLFRSGTTACATPEQARCCAFVKLMYCVRCHDVVRLFPERRYCRCGESWGEYVDNATTAQTWPSLSLGIANPDFEQAKLAFVENPKVFSPLLSMRSWINPVSEPDVTFVEETPDEGSTDEVDQA